MIDATLDKEGENITKEDILELDIPPKQKAKLIAKLTGLGIKECYNSLN